MCIVGGFCRWSNLYTIHPRWACDSSVEEYGSTQLLVGREGILSALKTAYSDFFHLPLVTTLMHLESCFTWPKGTTSSVSVLNCFHCSCFWQCKQLPQGKLSTGTSDSQQSQLCCYTRPSSVHRHSHVFSNHVAQF